MAELRDSGVVGVELVWNSNNVPTIDAARGVAALCAAHPGPAPLYVEWNDGNGTTARLRSRRVRVQLDEELLLALRELVGADQVRLVKAR